MADQERPPSVDEIALTIDVARRTIRKVWELVEANAFYDEEGAFLVDIDYLGEALDGKFPGWRKG